MLKRLKEKLKKRWKEFLKKEGRVPTTFKKTTSKFYQSNFCGLSKTLLINTENITEKYRTE